jgi:predicted esterase
MGGRMMAAAFRASLLIILPTIILPLMLRILTSLLLFCSSALAVESVLKDNEGSHAYLHTPTADAAKDKSYWLVIGVQGIDGKEAAGIAGWAKDDVIVLGPSFNESNPQTEARLKELIKEVGKSWKLRPKVFLHGFSAGADFVHRFAMKNPELVAGVSAASGGSWTDEINPAASSVSFAISCGQYDKAKAWPEAPKHRLEGMHAFGEVLTKAHFDVQSKIIPNIGHQSNADTLAFAWTAFQRTRALHFSRSVLLSCDFNDCNPLWSTQASVQQSPEGSAVTAVASWRASAGMIEKQGTAEHSGGLRLMVNSHSSMKTWIGTLTTGLLPVRTVETDLAKLTLAFDLASTQARAVRVVIESFDAEHQRSGGLEGTVLPAAPHFYHRHTLDLGGMKASGEGTFKASDPFIQISLSISDDLGWPATTGHELRLDNLCYTAPALYVSTQGDDKKGKGTLEAPFGTIQKAIDKAQPGDVIMVGEGLYETKWQTATVKRGGSPAAWITLRNVPGQTPILKSSAFNAVKIGEDNKGKPNPAPAVAYVEFRGLHVQGLAKVVKEKYADLIGKPKAETNGNGISFDGRYEANKPHHLRIANCTVYDCAGGGINVIHSDRVALEGNHCYDNCHWMVFAGSGLSIYQPFNFEAAPNEYRILARNNRCHDNYCTQPWIVTKKPSDGNGMIVDDTRNTQNKSTNGIYTGRILIQNNLSYANGGSGMHAFSSDRVDFINNTVTGNNTQLDYSQLGITQCSDCRVLNNILVAPKDKPVNRVNGVFSDILLSHNLFFGGNDEHVHGEHPILADPMFEDAEKGDFDLMKGSPAFGTGGVWEIGLLSAGQPSLGFTPHH